MDEMKVIKEFACSKLAIEYIAKDFNVTKSFVTKSIVDFLAIYKNKEKAELLKRKLKIALCKAFLSPEYFNVTDFASDYGVSEEYFISLAFEAVEDTSLIPSNYTADKIFRKICSDRTLPCKMVPKRIIINIALRYVNDPSLNHRDLAYMYNVGRNNIGNMLRRGIEENILDDDLAERVYIKIKSGYFCNTKVLDSYALAFDKRNAKKS